MREQKKVKDLVKYLLTKDQNTSIASLYDGNFHNLNVFEDKGVLVFTESKLDSDYQDAKIEFTTESIEVDALLKGIEATLADYSLDDDQVEPKIKELISSYRESGK